MHILLNYLQYTIIQMNLQVDKYGLVPSRPSVFVNQEFHGSVQEYISHEFLGEIHLLAIVEMAKPKIVKRNSQYFKDPTLDSHVMSSIRTTLIPRSPC